MRDVRRRKRQPATNSVKATDWEFRWRGLVIGLIFWAGFSFYWVDHVNLVEATLAWLARQTGLTAAGQGMVARGIFILAAVLATLASLLRTWASSFLSKEVVHDSALHAQNLVADGPYRYTRNPLYLGNILLAIAFAPLASRSGSVFMTAAVVVFSYRLILREEAELEAQQGESFRRFCARVPRLLPALSPRVEAGGRKPDWVSGFAAESYFWAFAVALAAFAATLQVRVFILGIVVGIVCLVGLGWLATRRRARAQ